MPMRAWQFFVAVLIALSAFLWAGDKITLEGEHTVYTVECHEGSWEGAHCTGKLQAGARFRFRVLKPHREVVFWTVGAIAPSGKFSDCDIDDGRNWVCRPTADATRTITLQMKRGEPMQGAPGRVKPFHAIAKWRWFVLHAGWPAGSDADA